MARRGHTCCCSWDTSPGGLCAFIFGHLGSQCGVLRGIRPAVASASSTSLIRPPWTRQLPHNGVFWRQLCGPRWWLIVRKLKPDIAINQGEKINAITIFISRLVWGCSKVLTIFGLLWIRICQGVMVKVNLKGWRNFQTHTFSANIQSRSLLEMISFEKSCSQFSAHLSSFKN